MRCRDPNDVPPGDWESPVPVYFLAVEAGAVFVFRIISRSHDDQSMADAERWLAQGLHDLGIGGKTAVGYGTFEPLHPSPAAGR
jgi:CRISPR-associated protein Cmr6